MGDWADLVEQETGFQPQAEERAPWLQRSAQTEVRIQHRWVCDGLYLAVMALISR